MKVFIITNQPFPHGMAPTKRILSYAKAIDYSKVECEVIVYRRTEVYGKSPKNICGIGVYDGVKYRYISGYTRRESNVFLRKINDYIDILRVKKYLNNKLEKTDIVFFYTPKVPILLVNCAHEKGAMVFRELCELPYGTGIESKKTASLRKKYEQEIMPLYDGFIPISDALYEYARPFVRRNCVLQKIPILVDFDKYEAEDRSAFAEYPYIFHAGTLFQQKDGFLDMLEAFALALPKLPDDVKFISTGYPSQSRDGEKIREIISKYSLEDKVIFKGYIDEYDLKEYLSKASFVIINKLTTQQNKYCFSTKLGEYMAASKPIIITRVGEAINWLTHEKDAYIIEPDNIKALSDAIVRLFLDRELRNKLSKNAQISCREKFDYRNYGDVLVKTFMKHE